ncbi:hypothetical protein QQX98_001581 [Neonectria punicea]|uniref:Heterokaryon incompatibility domain-containing protein n=1 Tax=Neonectria punicea TaxID=979145 RepID=A0ABR1HMW0_9HYPO
MATIYENAFLTIAATKAKGHNEGLHIKGEGERVHINRIPASEIGHGIPEDVYVRLAYSAPGGIKHWDVPSGPDQEHDDEWPLLTRAWVFQERLLSPRMLHFAKKELVWECRTIVSCDCGQEHKQTEDLEFRRLVCNQSIKTADVTPTQLRHLWYAIVGRYSRLMGNLTYESDVFPALSGLASRISGLLGDEYVAGLWRSNLVEGLLWSRESKRDNKSRHQPKSWRAPSWSWASVNDEISFPHSKITLGRRPELHDIYARVVDVACNPTGSQRTGPLSSATLTLSGWISHATVRVSHTERRSQDSGKSLALLDYKLASQHDGWLSPFCADHPEDLIDGESAVCLRLARIDAKDWYLVLVREYPGSDTYKRIGLCQGPDISWKWMSLESWRRRAEQRYHEKTDVIRIV